MSGLAAIVHFIIDPLHLMLGLVVAVVIAGSIHNKIKRRKWVAATGTLAILWAVNLNVPVIPYYMVKTLENRFQEGQTTNLDSIIILGGWQGNGLVFTDRGQPVYSGRVDRLIRGLEIAALNPDADVIFSGGLQSYDDGASEAERTKAALRQLGITDPRFMTEAASTNTAENARDTAEMLNGRDGRIGLVTSASHMPRAMAVFRAQGLEPIPLPTDYQTVSKSPPFRFLFANGITLTSTALREWVGLVAYRMLGRSNVIFPAP